jgi:hypothetical protein
MSAQYVAHDGCLLASHSAMAASESLRFLDSVPKHMSHFLRSTASVPPGPAAPKRNEATNSTPPVIKMGMGLSVEA